jgi:hypothetical protein
MVHAYKEYLKPTKQVQTTPPSKSTYIKVIHVPTLSILSKTLKYFEILQTRDVTCPRVRDH